MLYILNFKIEINIFLIIIIMINNILYNFQIYKILI